MIDKDALLAAIDAAKENSYGTDEQSSLGAKRRKSIEAYLGLNTNPAPEGRSQVVDRSVYETIHTQLPSLVKIFAGSSDEVCKAVPIGPDDELGAEQQTAVLNHVVTQQNQWEQICHDWIHDAMLLSNGYAMAYWDETEDIVQETYEGQSDDQVAALVQDPQVKVIQHSQAIDEEATQQAMAQWAQASQQAQVQGFPPPEKPGPVAKHDVVIERRENSGKVCIKVLPPEHCRVSVDTPDWTLRECPYFDYKEQKEISELRAMGLDVPDDINDNEDEQSAEDDARDRFNEDRDFTESGRGSARKVWVVTGWIRADVEGDGRARLYYFIQVGRTLLYAQQTARLHVSSMTTQPLPHRHIGMSEAETVMDIQEIQTAITRGGLDNLYLLNNGRHVVSSKVNLEDFLDARPGGVVRMLDDSIPADGHVMPLVHPVAFDQIIGSKEYFDQIRQNRTGASRYFSGTDANAINKTASGTMALQNMASMRVEHKARMMAPAVEQLFSCVQEIIQKHSNKPMTVQLRGGRWVTVDPQAWRTKRDIRISVGVGAGNKESMAMQLQGQLGAQLQLMQLGLAGPPQIHATVTELAKLGGFANPDRFWVDPSKQPPPPPQPSPDQIKAQTQLQLKQMEMQDNAHRFQAEMQAKFQEKQMEYEAKIRELQANLELQNANDQRDAMREQRKAETDAQIELLKEQNKKEIAAMQAEIEKYRADLDAQVKLTLAGQQAAREEGAEQSRKSDVAGIQQMLKEMSDQMNAPAEIVRDANGRAIGVKKGNVTRSIKRGPDGRALGVQ